MTSSKSNLVSVVVPFFCSDAYASQCISSLLAQSHAQIEIILVNDGSLDSTGDICDHFARTDGRIQVIHQENLGVVAARKAGAEAASGEFLGFVDGDDWIGPDYVRFMHDLMSRTGSDLVVSGHIREFQGLQERVPPRIAPGVYEGNALQSDILPTAIFNGIFFQHGISTYVWNKLFRRERALQMLSHVPSGIVMGEDAALTYPYLFESNRVALTAGGNYYYRQRHNSVLKSVLDVSEEYSRLSLLLRHLKGALESTSHRTSIREQLASYFYSLIVVRSGGIIFSPEDNSWYPVFPGLTSHQRIVVYSSGSFGQRVVSALSRCETFELVGWIDEDASESQYMGLPVSSPESISELEFDLLLIASIDSQYSASLVDRLRNLGVPLEKISFLDGVSSALERAVGSAGFDLETFEYLPQLQVHSDNE